MSEDGKSQDAIKAKPGANANDALDERTKRPVAQPAPHEAPVAKRIKVEPTETTVPPATNKKPAIAPVPINGASEATPTYATTGGSNPPTPTCKVEVVAEAESNSKSSAEGSGVPPAGNTTALDANNTIIKSEGVTTTSATTKTTTTTTTTPPSEATPTTLATQATNVPESVGSQSPEPNDPGPPQPDSVPEAPAPLAGTVAPVKPEAAPPLKALKMSHLRTKYTGELEYMLREFRKLERQLLGAKGATQIEESAGSRERREKLHSFILHLEDTIRQIELGCKLEAEGKSTVNVGVGGPDGTTVNNTKGMDAAAQELAKKQRADSVGLANLTHEKDEEENVQKLEEHILANLLPVKIRLKKQLAAQQGATRNPAGMPVPRRGMLQPSEADRGKGTFAAAADQKRKEAEALAAAQRQQHLPPAEPVHPDKTHFGKPLGRRGSSLTQKLHGQTLGSQERKHGHGVGLPQPPPVADEDSTILYAGMTPGSKQVESGVKVAQQVHQMGVDSPHLQDMADTNEEPASTSLALEPTTKANIAAPVPAPTPSAAPSKLQTAKAKVSQPPKGYANPPKPSPKPSSQPKAPKHIQAPPNIAPSATAQAIKKKLEDPTICDEERQKLRRKLKKKLFLRRARRREYERQRQAAMQQSAQTQGASKASGGRKKSTGGKSNGKKRGPRSVEYICALCSEAYSSVCEYNPWWALAQHECPKCRKTQIPRVDIGAPANAIEYHPALLAHADDNGASAAAGATENASNAVQVNQVQSSSKCQPCELPGEMVFGSDTEFGSDLSDITDGNLSDVSLDSNDSDADVFASMAPAEKAEHEKFGFEYKGPTLSESEASRLLVLMLHANGCPCRHKNAKQRDVCRSTKFMMLHIRDCPGTTAAFDVCPFPWCRKVKHLLYHLVSCSQPTHCAICSPTSLSPEMRNLARLNKHRLKRQRERLLESYKAGAAACPADPDPSEAKPCTVTSSKKPTATQRGTAHSKPKTAAIRAKVRGAVQPAERPTKAGKQAANAAQMQALDPMVATTVKCEPPAPTTNSDTSEPQPSKLMPSPTPTPAVVKPVGTASSAVVTAYVQEAIATIPPSGGTTSVHTTQNHAPDTLASALPSQSHDPVATTPTPGSVGSSARAEQPALPGPTNQPLPMAAAQALGAAEDSGLQQSAPSVVCVLATHTASCAAGGAATPQSATPLTKASTSVPVDAVAPAAPGAARGPATQPPVHSVAGAATVPPPPAAGQQPAMSDPMKESVPVDSVSQSPVGPSPGVPKAPAALQPTPSIAAVAMAPAQGISGGPAHQELQGSKNPTLSVSVAVQSMAPAPGDPAQHQPAVPSPSPVAATEAENAARQNAPQNPSPPHCPTVAVTPTTDHMVSMIAPVAPPGDSVSALPGAATPLATGLAQDVAPPTSSPVVPPGVDAESAQRAPTTLEPHRQIPSAGSSQVGIQPETIPNPTIVQAMASSLSSNDAQKLENASLIVPSGTNALKTATTATTQQAKVGIGIKTAISDEQSSPALTAELPAQAETTKKGSAVIPGSVFRVEVPVGAIHGRIVDNASVTPPSSSEQKNSPASALSPGSMASIAPAKLKVEEKVNGEAGEDCKLPSALPSATHDEQTPGATDLSPRSRSKDEDITTAAKEPIKSC